MTAPQALIEFFQKEATEYLGRLDRVLVDAESAALDAHAFLASARALRGSAAMTRLDGLPELAATVERIAAGLVDRTLRWDQRLHHAVHGALVELRALVHAAPSWSEAEQRRSRTHSVALAAVAAGYVTDALPVEAPAGPVIPVARLAPDDGLPAIIQRHPSPPMTLAQRFRIDMAAGAGTIARDAAVLAATATGSTPLAVTDALRRALLALAETAESYGATSIAAVATKMARAPLTSDSERRGIQSFAQLLMDRELSDTQLAQQVRQAAGTWSGAPSAPVIVPIESLLYRGHTAVTRARIVRDQLAVHWQRGALATPDAQALFDELSDLLDLAVTT